MTSSAGRRRNRKERNDDRQRDTDADSEQECERLRKDAERIDFLESTIRQRSAVWLLPCGESLRFMQVRHLDGDIDNHPTVEGLRAAIDAAMSEPKPQDQAA